MPVLIRVLVLALVLVSVLALALPGRNMFQELGIGLQSKQVKVLARVLDHDHRERSPRVVGTRGYVSPLRGRQDRAQGAPLLWQESPGPQTRHQGPAPGFK